MSLSSRSTTRHAFKSFALISETFLFSYLGISSVVSVKSVLHLEWSLILIAATAILCLIGRALHIFPLSFLSNLCARDASKRLDGRTQVFMWFSSIRGAIAFALALNVFTAHRAFIISTTIALVLLSTIGLGGMAAPMLRRLGLVEVGPRSLTSRRQHRHTSSHGIHTPLGVDRIEMSSPRSLDLDLDGTPIDAIGEGTLLTATSNPTSPVPPDEIRPRLVSNSIDDYNSSDESDIESVGLIERLWREFDEVHLQDWFGGYMHDRFPVEVLSRRMSNAHRHQPHHPQHTHHHLLHQSVDQDEDVEDGLHHDDRSVR